MKYANFALSLIALSSVNLGLSAPVWAVDCPSLASTSAVSHISWGIDLSNTRHQPNTKIVKDNVGLLQLAWVFALDGDGPHSYPLVSADSIFVGDTDGRLHALDRDSGCSRWVFQADAEVRSAIVPGTIKTESGDVAALFFGTFKGSVYAIQADSGELLWQIVTDPHIAATVTGTPLFYNNVLYVPVSSYEVILAAIPFYGCCDFRGSMLALNATNGERIWQRFTVEEQPEALTDNWLWPDKYGPSGAPVWSAPTLDLERNLLLFGSGENYSDPPTDGSDTIFALHMATGEVAWKHQFTAGDAWNAGCNDWFDNNCPTVTGPDLDFGAPPIVVEAGAQDIVLAGQKSANIFAMNAANGELLWERRLGRGGMLGGIHWGIAAHLEAGLVFIPVSDRETGASEFKPQPGVHALEIASGETRWFTPNGGNCTEVKENCHDGMSAAVISTPELLFAGGLDGWVHAMDIRNGEKLWSFDTWQDYVAINGLEVSGGAIDVHGPLVMDDLLIVTSGYAGFGQGGGNALLVFKLPQ